MDKVIYFDHLHKVFAVFNDVTAVDGELRPYDQRELKYAKSAGFKEISSCEYEEMNSSHWPKYIE